MNIQLSPKVFRVSVAPYKHNDPALEAELRAQKIVQYAIRAKKQLGCLPTHVLMSKELKVDLDVLEAAGLVVVRRHREHSLRLTVDLAVSQAEEAMV